MKRIVLSRLTLLEEGEDLILEGQSHSMRLNNQELRLGKFHPQNGTSSYRPRDGESRRGYSNVVL
jgi:hypothetical protein